MSQRKNLSDLLQDAEQLTTDIGGEEELPRVRRNLHQIAEAGQRLLTRTTAGLPEEHTDVKASILLGSRGFDIPKLSQRLETLNAAKTLEPLEPVWETDIEGFLRNERENTLLAVIEESKKSTFTEADKRQWLSMEGEWEKEKEKILNSLLGSGQDFLELPSQNETITSDPLSMHGRSALNAVEMAYAREVYRANEAKLRDLSHTLVNEFHKAIQNDKGIKDSWSLLKTLIDVPTLPPKAYEHRTSLGFQKDFVNQARSFLEQQYLDYIKELVFSSLSQAKLGGIPSTLNLVHSYLTLKQANSFPDFEDGTVSEQPLWALVFYCMRCGDLKDALKVITEANTCSDIAHYLQEYIDSSDRRLPPSSESKLQLQYRRSVRNSLDPFKRAVYCLLACCDISDNHSQVLIKTEDYMWLKLCQLHFEPVDRHTHTNALNDRMSLSYFQKLLFKDYGESHFNAVQNPHLYFQILLLSLQFEAAISFLSQNESLRSHAVHFALALHDLELLNLTKSFHSNLFVEEPNGIQRINLGRLVVSYTRKFALTDPREALEYFYRLSGLQDGRDKDLFLSCVSDLTMESREFEMLLGKIQPDGSCKPGCIDKFGSQVDIVGFIAVEAEEKGLFEDSVRLYDLAKNHGKVIEILCRLMSGIVSAPSTPQSDRSRIQNLAVSIAERYRNLGQLGSHVTSNTFFLLLDLMQFFDHYHAKSNEVALQIMKDLKLLPLQDGETVEQKVAVFRRMDDLIRQCYPDILLALMSILYTQYRQTSIGSPQIGIQDGGQEVHKNRLRHMARTLITFSGMIPYQMSGDVNARLVQMEVLMN